MYTFSPTWSQKVWDTHRGKCENLYTFLRNGIVLSQWDNFGNMVHQKSKLDREYSHEHAIICSLSGSKYTISAIYSQLFSNPIHLIKTTLIKESSKLSSGCIMHNKSPTIYQKCLFHSSFMDIALGQTPLSLTWIIILNLHFFSSHTSHPLVGSLFSSHVKFSAIHGLNIFFLPSFYVTFPEQNASLPMTWMTFPLTHYSRFIFPS